MQEGRLVDEERGRSRFQETVSAEEGRLRKTLVRVGSLSSSSRTPLTSSMHVQSCRDEHAVLLRAVLHLDAMGRCGARLWWLPADAQRREKRGEQLDWSSATVGRNVVGDLWRPGTFFFEQGTRRLSSFPSRHPLLLTVVKVSR